VDRQIAERPSRRRGVTRGLTGRLFAVSAAVLVLCACMFGVVLWLVGEQRSANDELRTSNARLETANRLLALVVDLETSLRGYVVTRDGRFLDPYRHGIQALPAAQLDFVTATAGDPQQSAAARRIVARVRDYMRWQTTQVLQAQQNPRLAARAIAAGQGKRRVDALRRQVSAVKARERVARDALHNETDAARHRTVTLVVAGMLGVPLLVILLAVSLARGVLAPIRRVADAAGRLQAGELDARVDEHAPGEAGTLAHAFNAMAESLKHSREELEQHNAELEAQGAELARTVEELEREQARIETFHAVVAALASEAELDRLAPQVLSVLKAAAAADAGALYVVDPIEPERGIALSEVDGLDRQRLPPCLTPGAGLPRRAADEGRPVTASAAEASLGFRHELHLPLVHGERARRGDPRQGDGSRLRRRRRPLADGRLGGGRAVQRPGARDRAPPRGRQARGARDGPRRLHRG
jgi:CHASE3 domain sensor protein